MTERVDGGSQPPKSELRESIREMAQAQIERIEALSVLIGGEGAIVEQVFPTDYMDQPESVRADAPVPDWTAEQILEAIKVAQELGLGSKLDIVSGLTGGTRILEGGKVWKVAAELEAAKQDGDPTRLIFAGSQHRKLDEEEHAFISERYRSALEAGATEYDFTHFLARTEANDFSEYEGFVQPFGYELTEENPTVRESTGQLRSLGHTGNGSEVMLLRIDREDYKDESGKDKYRHQPRSVNLMGFISDVLKDRSMADEPVALVTSNAYASRIPDTIRASLKHDRQFGVAMYGRATMAEVRQQPIQPGTPLNQLPGELGKMSKRWQTLLDELNQ